MPTIEQKEMHRQLRAQVRGVIEDRVSRCKDFGTPKYECLELFKVGVEKPCFDACYRLFMEKLFGTQGTKS